jgi:hypothetical protein
MRTFNLAIAALGLSLMGHGAAHAQAASANGLIGSGVAGPMTARGGIGDQMNAGRAIPYTRPLPGGVTRYARPPRENRYGYGAPYGGGFGYGPPLRPGRRDWVYDRPWQRYPYAPPVGYGSVYVR